MRTEFHIGIFDLITFLGVIQGLFLSWFFIKNSSKERKPNLFQGLLIFALTMQMLEEMLNNTGYIVKVLPISNFGESFIFTFAPLFYLYIKSSLTHDFRKREWLHFLPAAFWLLYLVFFFIQPDEAKYNSYVYTKHPDWPTIAADYRIGDDPLHLRRRVNESLGIHLTIYTVLSIILLVKKIRPEGYRFFRIEDRKLKSLRNATIHFMVIIAAFSFVKLYFGRDMGDYLLTSYMTLMIYFTSYNVLDHSSFLDQPYSFLDFSSLKYKKSSLADEQKDVIHQKIHTEMETNRYFVNNMASLSDLAKRIHESTHHVSQVINERLKVNFFELLARYRVEEAKKLIRQDRETSLTVEELAERVGYNSKSAFNNAFKSITSITPSEFRKSLKNS